MRVVVSGGAGFIGGRVVERLVTRADDVVALVRDPSASRARLPSRVKLIRSDLTDVAALTETMRGADAVVHLAGDYRIGIPADARPAMEDANVGTTRRMLDAAAGAAIARVVYVSTVNTLGNSKGSVRDET